MAEQGISIVEKDGVFHLAGVLNENADFSSLVSKPVPLKLNMRNVSRFNSIGIRNLLKFLSEWGQKPFEYIECPSEFIDQVNMIPALLGAKRHGEIRSFFVPYECQSCDFEEEVLGDVDQYAVVAQGGEPPMRKCPKCAGTMNVQTDSFLVFLSR